jgi:hypothetical protein
VLALLLAQAPLPALYDALQLHWVLTHLSQCREVIMVWRWLSYPTTNLVSLCRVSVSISCTWAMHHCGVSTFQHLMHQMTVFKLQACICLSSIMSRQCPGCLITTKTHIH